jgi:hypothetical protein
MDSNLNQNDGAEKFTDIQITIWRIQQLEELKKTVIANKEKNSTNTEEEGHTFIFPELLWPDKDII